MKWRNSIFSFITVLLLGLVFLGGFGYAAAETTVEKILANKDSYNGKEVSVSGTVSKINPFDSPV
jgi:outer membrane lipoprotein-sorting protein